MDKTFSFKAKVWLYQGENPWHFITIPAEDSDFIQAKYGWNSRGFGSLKVEVTIGKTSWKTSIFPDKKADSYILPVKAEVRKNENIKAEDEVLVSLKVL